MLRTRTLVSLVTVSMIMGAFVHAILRHPMANAQAANQAAPPREQQSKQERGVAVLCQVAGGGLVLSMVPEGTVVKTGDLLCELDTSELRDRLTEHEIAAKRSENESKTGQLAHQAALMAVKEYQEGTYLEARAAVQCEIKRAESKMAIAAASLDEVTRLFEKGNASKAQKVSAELSFQETKFALELGETKFHLMESLTKPNTIKKLIGEVERSRSQELAANEILELRRGQAKRVRQQVDHCRITAPCDGRVVYASSLAGASIHEGDRVHERQRLLRILPPAS